MRLPVEGRAVRPPLKTGTRALQDVEDVNAQNWNLLAKFYYLYSSISLVPVINNPNASQAGSRLQHEH